MGSILPAAFHLRVAPTQAVRHDLNMGLPTSNSKLSGYLWFCIFRKWIIGIYIYMPVWTVTLHLLVINSFCPISIPGPGNQETDLLNFLDNSLFNGSALRAHCVIWFMWHLSIRWLLMARLLFGTRTSAITMTKVVECILGIPLRQKPSLLINANLYNLEYDRIFTYIPCEIHKSIWRLAGN